MTLRETYIQGLISLLEVIPWFGANVTRSMSVAFSREESPMVIVHRGAEDVENSLGDDTDRHCEIRVSVLSRADAPDQEADEVLERAHPVIMQFQAPGVILVVEVGTDEPRFAGADGSACVVTTRYRIHYSSSRLSLSD